MQWHLFISHSSTLERLLQKPKMSKIFMHRSRSSLFVELDLIDFKTSKNFRHFDCNIDKNNLKIAHELILVPCHVREKDEILTLGPYCFKISGVNTKS